MPESILKELITWLKIEWGVILSFDEENKNAVFEGLRINRAFKLVYFHPFVVYELRWVFILIKDINLSKINSSINLNFSLNLLLFKSAS